MDVREKLVEILQDENNPVWRWFPNNATMAQLADYLINSGVTVQEWISVYDELPETGRCVVCIAKRNPFSRFMPMVARIEKNGWVNPITEQYISEVTHWMPMPNPPKGE